MLNICMQCPSYNTFNFLQMNFVVLTVLINNHHLAQKIVTKMINKWTQIFVVILYKYYRNIILVIFIGFHVR